MNLFLRKLCNCFRVALPCLILFGLSTPAHADWGIVDSLNLAPFVPIVLDALMSVATGGYEFFVGNGTGIIYVLIWGFLGIAMAWYLLRMYFPKTWLGFLGIKSGGEMFDKPPSGFKISEDLLKPALRAIIAATLLLQVKPIYVTEWIVDPFLKFGALYTESIVDSINMPGMSAPQKIECPTDIVEHGWISRESCEFMVQPVATLSHTNNQVIKRGFDFINRGLTSLMTLIPHGGEGFLNLITGILLVSAFVASNFFMALLIIQGIFNFGMALILYPFQVLVWVVKPNDKWVDLWPAFEGIIKALQQLIVTMIACAFILVVNIAVVRALFQWNSSVFVVAAGGFSSSNIPSVANNAMGFGQHSILWLSAILTFYLMVRIFELTREQLKKYVPLDGSLHKTVTGDAKSVWKNTQTYGKKVVGLFKKKK
ncbi:hypothetical protein LJC18_04535 [Lachnospiraceae bacterium OttesenSCG-928-E19]|nr:hypothetical protein [Lachnospiraceae bacterium OttesenSCG-928-E19]